MKVYNRTDFLKLPSGIIFCKGVQWAFENMSVKCDTIYHHDSAIDFYYLDLCDMESKNSEERCEYLEESLKNGKSYPINESEMRDGCFDDENIFLVFDTFDLLKIHRLFTQSILTRVHHGMDFS